MNCPRTGTQLREVDIDGTKVDVSEACGGLWLDSYELLKFDEAKESAGEKLIDLMSEYSGDDIYPEQRLNCPRDSEVVMMRRFYSVKRQIEIDECPKCGGIWLDAGELTKIREAYPTKEARDEAVYLLSRHRALPLADCTQPQGYLLRAGIRESS